MAFAWNETYSTGLDWQDTQHKELLGALNQLVESMKAGTAREEVARTIAFLDSYVKRHFGAEEVSMARTNYPEREAHMMQHKKFSADFESARREFEKGVSATTLIKTQQALFDWFVNHIGRVDKRLGAYIVANG